MGRDWKYGRRKELKKIVFALTEDRLKPLVTKHEDRGWVRVSEIKPYNGGVGCLMACNRR